MKKVLIIFSLIFLSGCTNPAKNLKANIFADLWNEYVVEKDLSVLVNKTTHKVTQNTERKFEELNDEIYDLRKFLILGENETTTGLKLKKFDHSSIIKNPTRIFCVEEKEEINCFAVKYNDNLPVNCYESSKFKEKIKATKDSKEFCTYTGEVIFKEGLMKIAGENNDNLVSQFKEILKLISGKNILKKSLLREVKKIKKDINKTCKKQKTSKKCGLQ